MKVNEVIKSDVEKTISEEERDKIFNKIAQQQRGKPEKFMVDLQYIWTVNDLQ